MTQPILIALLIFVCRVVDVSMGTLRMLFTVRGKKYVAGTIGVFEVAVFLFAITSVMKNMDYWPNFVAYCLGFGSGTVLGIKIEETLAPGNLWVTIISKEKYSKVAESLRTCGCGVTESFGLGMEGPVDVLTTIIFRKDFTRILDMVKDIDPEAFITSDHTHLVHRGYLHKIKRK